MGDLYTDLWLALLLSWLLVTGRVTGLLDVLKAKKTTPGDDKGYDKEDKRSPGKQGEPPSAGVA